MTKEKSKYEIEQEEFQRTAVILGAAAITIVMSLVIVALVISYLGQGFIIGAFALVIYLPLHVLIGRLLVGIVLHVFNEIDDVFELTENTWGKWTREAQILWAAAWPFTFPPCFIVGIIALIFGNVYTKMF